MTSGVISRSAEFRAVSEFLLSAELQPTGLVIEGEAGIGKTTIWLAAVTLARDRGFRVFSARAGQAESVLAYAAVADLLGDVDPAVLAALPDVQRLAVDRVLLRASSEGPATDQHVVAAAFAAVLDRLSGTPPSSLRSTTCSGWTRPARPLSHTPHGSSTAESGCWSPSGAIPTAQTW